MCVKGIVLITSFIHRMAQGRESKHSEESGRIVEIETLPIRWAESAGWDSFRCSIRLEQSEGTASRDHPQTPLALCGEP